MQDNLLIREIVFDSDDYRRELELRQNVLRAPLGLNIYDDDLQKEHIDFHFGAFFNDELLGTIILSRVNDSEIKMRQVAVQPSFRGKNIGTRMVIFSEDFARSRAYKKMILNSRKTAIPFYQKLGYKTLGEEFIEVTVPHYKMEKELK